MTFKLVTESMLDTDEQGNTVDCENSIQFFDACLSDLLEEIGPNGEDILCRAVSNLNLKLYSDRLYETLYQRAYIKQALQKQGGLKLI